MAEFQNSLGNIGSGGGIDQNNILISATVSFLVEDRPFIDQITDAINTQLPLIIVSEKQLLIFNIVAVNIDGKVTSYRYWLKNKGKGQYGIGGTTLTDSSLQFISVSETTIDDIENNPDSLIYTLGDISSTNISDYINSYTPSLLFQSISDGGTLIKVTNNGNNEAYLFLSTSGLYGLNDLQTTPENFQLIPENNTLQDYIPLSGTEINKNVTGKIQFEQSAYLNVTDGVDDYANINFDSFSNIGIEVQKNNLGDIQVANFKFDPEYLLISGSNQFKGILGSIVFDKQDDPKAFVQLDDLQNGYIPLTGTITDNPVVGDIEFNESIKIFHSNGDYGSYIKLEDGGVFLEGINENSELTSFRFDQRGEITFESNTSDSKGIIGNREFNYDGDRNVYVQKGYVDDAITTGGGAYIPLTQKGAVNGVAPLNSTSKIDALYLPSYVDDVLEFATLAVFPVTGETGKIYVALNTNKTYRWSGSAYVEISPSDVNSVAGLTGVITSAGLRTALSINNLDNTSDLNKPISTLTQTALNAKLSQGGNSFGTTLQVGSSDAQNVSIMRNNIPYLQLMSGDIIQTRDDMTFYGIAGPTFSSLKMGNASGTNSISVRRNRPDAVTTFAVDNQNASSTGNIMDFLSNSISVANFNKTGQLTIPNATADTHSVALGQLSTNSLSALTTLSLATTSRVMYYTYTGATTSIWTLPTIGTSVKVRYVLINTGTGIVTINSNAGGNDIWDSGTLSNTTVLTPGSSMELFNNGNSFIIL